MERRKNSEVKQKVCDLCADVECLSLNFCGTSSAVTSSVGFTVNSLGSGLFEYDWTVNYVGETAAGSKFGQIEIYLPFSNMGTGSDANGGSLTGTFTGGAGTNVTVPWNAGHFDASHQGPGSLGWTQARVDLESPDQEGFDPNLSEIAFLTDAADSAAGIYNFSYVLDAQLGSFRYELHGAEEADPGFQSGVASVPLPPSALLFASGLLGSGGL